MTIITSTTRFLPPIFERGFEGILESIQLLLNSAMKLELGEALNAHPFERSEERKGYANGYKNKTVHTKYGKVDLDVPQVRCDINIEKADELRRTLISSENTEYSTDFRTHPKGE